jgi:type IV secretion system T-DNA border endonuclease VirD2
MSAAPSLGFDPSPWLAANAALAARIATGRSRGAGLLGIRGLDVGSSQPGRTITADRDEERRRGLTAIAARGGRQPGGVSLGLSGMMGGVYGLASRGDAGAAFASTAALLSRGYQPAVVKVVSYAHGAKRATASAQYIERDEVELETHDGLRLPDKAAVAEEIKAWSSSFEKRSPSQDVVTVRLQLSGLRDNSEDRERLAAAAGAAFEGHRHAVRIDALSSGHLEARAVLVMARTISPEEKAANRAARANGEMRPALPPRIRVVEQRMGTTDDAPMRKVFDARSEAAMKARIETATGYPQHGISIEPATPGHGRDALGQRLSTLIAKAPARDHLQRPIRHAEDIREVTRDWGRHLRSQTPRDTMHMVVSAKAGTDEKAFANAVRAFLHQQFADHKFMFGVHTDKSEAGHIHAHAIVAVRSESGTKLHPGPTDFAQWRVNYASHAREHGLQVVATRAAEQASSRSYGPKDKSIVDVATNPRPQRKEQDRAYTSDPRNANLIRNAQERMAIARANPIRIPMTERERAGLHENLEHWRAEAKASPHDDLARSMVQRLNAAHEAGKVFQDLKQIAGFENPRTSAPMIIANERLASDMTHPPRSATDMLQDLQALNKQVANVTVLLPEGSRAKFIERAGTFLETIASKVDQRRLEEARIESEHKLGERQPVTHGTNKTEEAGSREIPGIQNARTTARQVAPGTSASILLDTRPGAPLEAIRRQQAEMLERFVKERQQAKGQDKGHEAGE